MSAFRKGPTAEERCKLLQQHLDQIQKENEQLMKAREEIKIQANKNKLALDQYLKQAEVKVRDLQGKLNELNSQSQSSEKVIQGLLQQLDQSQQLKENVKYQVEEELINGEAINESVIQTSPELQQLLDRAHQDEPIYFVDNQQRVWEIVPRDDLNFELNQQIAQNIKIIVPCLYILKAQVFSKSLHQLSNFKMANEYLPILKVYGYDNGPDMGRYSRIQLDEKTTAQDILHRAVSKLYFGQKDENFSLYLIVQNDNPLNQRRLANFECPLQILQRTPQNVLAKFVVKPLTKQGSELQSILYNEEQIAITNVKQQIKMAIRTGFLKIDEEEVFCALCEDCLLYSKTQQFEECDRISLDSASVLQLQSSKNKNAFQIVTPEASYVLQTKNQKDKNE